MNVTPEVRAESKFSEKWRELVMENPMAIEISRFRRRFFEGGRGKTVNTMVLVVAIVAYASLLLIIANMAGDFPPVALVFLQTAVFAFLGPALMYTSIAGEREKRSWDLLCVAPITHAQIVVGKFLAALAGLAAALILFLIPTLFTALTYKGDYSSGYGVAISGTWALIFEEMISVSFGMCLAAMTLLFSARCKRSLMALGIVLSMVFLLLLAFPALASSVSGGGNIAVDIVNIAHPFLAIARLEDIRHASSGYGGMDFLSAWWYGIPQTVLYLTFTAIFLVWAEKTVNFADGEKKFIPRKTHA